MAFETTSPNMLLPVPGVGQTTGPQYATDVNNCLTIIDSHNHSNGSGVQITPAGMNISADLAFLGNNATQVRSVRFSVQSNTLSAPDLGAVYVNGVDLFYTDVNGLVVQLTKNGGVNGTPGNIGGLTGTASVNFAANTFVFQSSTNTPGNLDGGSITIRNNSANANGVTLQPINALGTSYTLTLPTIPTTNSFVTLDTSGNLAANVPQSSAFLPSGILMAYGGASAPSGWLVCDGTAVSRSTYAALFSAIGSTYGAGDGSTTFNLPDARNLFLRGANSAARTVNSVVYPAVTLGATVNDTFQQHSHNVNDPSHTHNTYQGSATGGPSGGLAYSGNNQTTAGTILASTTGVTVADPATLGSNPAVRTGVETAPIYLGVNYIIKT